MAEHVCDEAKVGSKCKPFVCFECGDEGHWKNTCPLLDKPCIKGCGGKMKLLWSKQAKSKGCRFLKCKESPRCQGFFWVDEPPTMKEQPPTMKEQACTASSSGGTVKLTIPGEIPMIVEGSVDDITDLMKRLR